jgi:hypothetical protein
MDIIRHDDGSLTVPIVPSRHADDHAEPAADADSGTAADTSLPDGSSTVDASPDSRVLRPGEGGYLEALAEWDMQQHPDRGDVVSTASGRDQAMAVIHAVAEDREHVAEAVAALDDPEAGAESLRHVLVGGTPSVQAFASEIAEAEGGEELAPHTATKIIGEVLAEIDGNSA